MGMYTRELNSRSMIAVFSFIHKTNDENKSDDELYGAKKLCEEIIRIKN